MNVTRSKWFMPAFSLALGAACLAAFWIGGDRDDGLRALGMMGLLAAILLVGGRSELIRGLRGDGRDEYWARLDHRATLVGGHVAIGGLIVMCLWEWAHGRSGTPYTPLAGISGLAYLTAVAVLRWRG